MSRRNALGLAALLLLFALVLGGSLLCQPASERDALPPESEQWRERPASAPTGELQEPLRGAADPIVEAAVYDVVVRVVDQDGRPVLGAEVFLNWADKPGAAAAARAFTDLDGITRFARLPRARYRMHAMADGYFPSAEHLDLAVPTPTLQELVLPLERSGVISGFVYGLDGFEIPFAWIRLRDLDTGETSLTRADERGSFRSVALRRGAWEAAWIEHEQAEPDPRIVWSAVIEPGDHVELIVTLDRTTRGEPRDGRAVGIEIFRRDG